MRNNRADYFASPDTMFPVWRRKDILPTNGLLV